MFLDRTYIVDGCFLDDGFGPEDSRMGVQSVCSSLECGETMALVINAEMNTCKDLA